MKRVVIFLIILIVFIQACQKKALPIITTRVSEPSRPIAIVNVKPDTAIGKIIFTNRCSRCHALPVPSQYTEQRWDGILSIMIPRAGLDKEQEIHVTAFLKANCIR